MKVRSKRSKKSGGQLFHGAKFRDPKFLDFVRAQPCVLRNRWYYAGGDHTFENCDCVIYHVCPGAVRACHVKSRGAGGVDRANVYAGCDYAHDAQGRLGIPAFEKRWGVNLRAEALRLQALYESQT